MKTEWSGSIFTSETPLANNERLALWILKRGNMPLWLKSFRKPVSLAYLPEPRYRTVAGGMEKDTLTGFVHEPLIR